MDKDEHLTVHGIIKIINLKASLNKGLSNELKISFPKVIAIIRPKINLPITINYNWIAGFFTGEGCFSVTTYKYITLRVSISQHSRDKLLINNLMNTLNCGAVSKDDNAVVLTIYKIKDVYNKITSLFNEYKIRGVKSLDFQDFCKIAKLVNEKAHLIPAGLEEIQKIKLNMNKGRLNKRKSCHW
jgi:hypothetical protein